MAVIRIPEMISSQVQEHLFSDDREHFAFLLSKHCCSHREPMFLVQAAHLVPDKYVKRTRKGYELATEGILQAINAAVRADACLIEAHNHSGTHPRFSRTDLAGFKEFVPYVLDSLPKCPYAATVWSDTTIYGKYFLPSGEEGTINSVTIQGSRLQQAVSRSDDGETVSTSFSRQIPWFTEEGQRHLGRLKVAIVGAGGTGSHIIRNLAYLGVREFLLVDDDTVEDSNMNRLVTATAADLGTPKVIVGRRAIKSIAPKAQVTIVEAKLPAPEALDALKGVDLIFGCVDNDGARLILNELAVAYAIPYLDLAVGIDASSGVVSTAGGRVAIVLPGMPCLLCMNEIDVEEARFYLGSSEYRDLQAANGYVQGMDIKDPAVVSLNGLIANVALNEFAMLVSGVRPINIHSTLDLMGSANRPGQRMVATEVKRESGCVHCARAGSLDATNIERYANISVQ